MDEPSERVVEQRIRNRVIEWLELASSFAEQVEYDRALRAGRVYPNVAYEVINQFEDWVSNDPRAGGQLDVYPEAETLALGRVYAAWAVAADALPKDYPSIATAQALPEWGVLRSTAESALKARIRDSAVKLRVPEL